MSLTTFMTGLPRSLMLHATEGQPVPRMVVCTEVHPGTTTTNPSASSGNMTLCNTTEKPVAHLLPLHHVKCGLLSTRCSTSAHLQAL